MHRLKRFIEQEKRLTEARIARQGSEAESREPSLEFLEGRLEVLNLLSHAIDRLQEEEILLSGAGSAFSPQG
jgi:hypothetical protein